MSTLTSKLTNILQRSSLDIDSETQANLQKAIDLKNRDELDLVIMNTKAKGISLGKKLELERLRQVHHDILELVSSVEYYCEHFTDNDENHILTLKLINLAKTIKGMET